MDPIEITTVLDTTPEVAFRSFSSNIAEWWPVATHSMSKGVVRMETGVGGKIIETAKNGDEHVWGHVTAWTEFSQINLAWYVGDGVENGTDISVAFLPTDDGRTGVTLIHSGWERLGDAARGRHGNYVDGWTRILGTHYAQYIAKTCQSAQS